MRWHYPDSLWRGPVWLDQAFFAIGGLNRYGFTTQADAMLHTLFSRGQGMAEGDSQPISQYYNPLTGERQGADHFSWTAAHILLMLFGDYSAY